MEAVILIVLLIMICTIFRVLWANEITYEIRKKFLYEALRQDLKDSNLKCLVNFDQGDSYTKVLWKVFWGRKVKDPNEGI